MVQGGFISFDAANPTETEEADTQRKKKKFTWYRADVEPCLGTALFLEVPLEKEKAGGGVQAARLLKDAINRSGKRTLVLNPTGLKRRRSRVNKVDSDEDYINENKSFGRVSSHDKDEREEALVENGHSPQKRRRKKATAFGVQQDLSL